MTSDRSTPLLQLQGVRKTYTSANAALEVLKGIDFEIRPGEFVAVMGKSGAGKTTLVNMIAGIDALSGGEVLFAGASVHHLGENQRSRWRGRSLGIVYQSFHLLPTLSLLHNVLFPMDVCGLYHPRRSRARALELLRSVELEEHAQKLPSAISGGQQQRAAIARALANDPPLILADEPTGRLDTITAETILRVFEELAAQGKAVLMVTHEASLAGRVTRCLRLENGLLHPYEAG